MSQSAQESAQVEPIERFNAAIFSELRAVLVLLDKWANDEGPALKSFLLRVQRKLDPKS